MIAQTIRIFVTGMLLAAAGTAGAQDLLIRNTTVHTATESASLDDRDVLIRDGKITAIGTGLRAEDGVQILNGEGRQLTPGLFGGVTAIGIEEISLAADTVDSNFELPLFRPEFQAHTAFNPYSSLVAINRFDGITHAVVAPQAAGTILAGQGRAVRLDGGFSPYIGHPLMVFDLGSDSAELSGNSRAAQYMLLDQAFSEARASRHENGPHQLLTTRGRQALDQFTKSRWPVLFEVDRASDILEVLRFAARKRIKPVILGGAEAWMVADRLQQAEVPVIMDPLANAPADFDRIGARLDNAALLDRAGVTVMFTMLSDHTHNARKVRQLAGNAVANGMDWQAALAALTRNPATVFGYTDTLGTIEVGRQADLVLWSGDPLEVTTVAEQVIMAGRAMPMESRQTKLRDRYLPASPDRPRAYIKP